MTFIVDGTNGLTFPNSTTQTSAGKVVQVVNATTTTITTTTTATFIATTLTGSITPKFTTSKILILVAGIAYTNAVGGQCTLQVYKNGSNLSGYVVQNYGSASTVEASAAITWLDSPATTSATTYTIYMANTTSLGTSYFPNTGTATITLMEIAA